MPSTSEAAITPPGPSPQVSETPRRAREIPSWVVLVITGLLLLAFAVWMVGPRFSVPGPSFVDDWSNLDNAPVAFDELADFSYDPAEAHDTRRYRPGYTAVWNSLQWRTFGAPDSMTGPNFWAIVRLALLVAGLVVMAGAVLTPDGRRRHPVALAVWAAIPAAMLISTPGLARDLARLGPVEPMLVAAMACGLAVVVASTRRLVESGRSRWPWLVSFAAGYSLWLLGVYQKEASICALALLPFLYFFLDRRWRAAGAITLPLYRSKGFLLAAALLVLPLVHMLFEIRNATEGGVTVYGNAVPSGLEGWAQRFWDSATMQYAHSGQLGTYVWLGVAAAVPFLLVAWVLNYRRVPWLPLGLLATGVAVFLFQGLGGVPATRYFIPFLGLLAVSAVAFLADGPRWIQAAALAMVVVFMANNVDRARSVVDTWARDDKAGLAAIADVAELNPARCPVFMAAFHAEDADAYPELVALQDDVRPRPCDPRFRGVMIHAKTPFPPVTNEAIYETCAGPGWEPIKSTPIMNIMGCRRFEKRRVHNQVPAEILRWNRLVPGQRLSERIHALPDESLCRAQACMGLLAHLRATYR